MFCSLTRSKITRFACSLATVILAPLSASAYFSTIDTGEMLTPGTYSVGFEPQIIFNKFDGINAIGRFDVGIDEQSSARALLGFGKVDFQMGGFYKWVPFPDTATQPAVGGQAGIEYARVNGENELNFRVHPLVSKRFETEVGDVIPYGALPLGLSFRKDETVVPLQVVAGSEFRLLNLPNTSFFAELGIDVVKSFSYLSAAFVYRFDDSSLRSRK